VDRLQEYIDRVKELSPDVIVKEAKIEDGHDFVKLFNKHYKRKTNIDYYNWQFFKSSLLSKLFMAYEGQELIGIYGIKISSITSNAKIGFAVDFLIDEAHRKKGIAFLLEGAVQKFCFDNDVSIIAALPNIYGNSAFKSMGWKSLAKIDTLLLKNSDFVKFDSTVNISCTEKETSLISFVKDKKYCFWRFDQHPFYKYESIIINKDVFAVIKKFEDSLTGAIVGDIVDIKYTIEEFDNLFEKVMDKMIKMKINAVSTWALPHTKLYQLLLEKGFESVAQERFFCIKYFGDNPVYFNIENWNIVQIDAEIF